MRIVEDRRYTEEHEWVLSVDDTHVRIGITDYAQDALGDVVYVELPSVGDTFREGDTMAEVESTKSVAEVYAPISGTVSAVNEALNNAPELVNRDPYGDGWFVELESDESVDLSELLDAAAYEELTT
jgi:glycine cleavage system H protein